MERKALKCEADVLLPVPAYQFGDLRAEAGADFGVARGSSERKSTAVNSTVSRNAAASFRLDFREAAAWVSRLCPILPSRPGMESPVDAGPPLRASRRPRVRS